MTLVTQSEAARLLKVSRRTLDRKKDLLESMGFVQRYGLRVLYETACLREALNSVSELQVGNAERMEAEVQQEPAAEIPSYPESRASREHFLARLAELEVSVREGQLVDAAATKTAGFEQGRRIRNQIFSLPSRIAADLAAESDPAAVAIMLEKQLVECLTALTDGGTDG